MNAEGVARDPLDPQIRQFVSALERAWARYPAVESLPVAEKRRIAEIVRTPWREGGPTMATTRDTTLPTRHGPVRVRIHRPVADVETQPALIYLHGGGWTMFSLDTHDRIMRELAARAAVTVVGVDYALSPEAKFPHALEQIVDAVRALHGQASSFGIDAARLAIGGDSAGANLSVATSLVLRGASTEHPLRGMLLIYGCYTNEISVQAANGFGAEGNLLTAAEMATFWHNYLVRPDEALDPLAAPLRAELAGLPRAFLLAAQCDVLAEQSRAFAAKLCEAGVPADFTEYPGATHSFLEAISVSKLADRAIDDCAAWLRGLFR
ncbi:alpha/beta hydrolase fold domain-containing protein [Rudaea sp.]|uniref:alpha/beta hydrolase fold domain-containing protein n=1 Tax=Rudaea sp. TaxID=2136325 RepID=UPI002ED3625F